MLEDVRVEMSLPKKVMIKDVTLREGEETPRVVMSVEDKLAIACKLAEIGVEELDVGYVATIEEHRKIQNAIKMEGIKIKTAAHTRSFIPDFKEEIDHTIAAGVDVVNLILYRISIPGFQKSDYVKRVAEAVDYSKKQGAYTSFLSTPTNWDLEFVRDIYSAAVRAGADRVVIGGLGCLHPTAFKYMVRFIKDIVGEVPVGVHCHNDFGLGTACSLTAVEAGAEIVETCVNGMCDRAGMAAFEEVAMSLTTLYGVDTGLQLEKLGEISKLVQGISRIPNSPFKPIVGANMFMHNTDGHIEAVLKGGWYMLSEFRADIVGNEEQILFGPATLQGRALKLEAEMMGLYPTDEQLRAIIGRISQKLKTQDLIIEEEAKGIIREVLAK